MLLNFPLLKFWEPFLEPERATEARGGVVASRNYKKTFLIKPNVDFSANQAAQNLKDVASAAAGGTTASAASSGCKGEGGSDCIFPFKYRGATFNNCKMSDNWRPNSASGKYGWCATEVETEGKKALVMKTWENCVKACKKLTRKRYF